MVKNLEIFQIPKNIYFGPEALNKLPELLREYEYRGSILVLTGKYNSRRFAEKILTNNYHLESIEYGDFCEVENLLNQYRNRNISCIVCIGGGKVIDIGKTLAYLTNRSLISVPTVASHDGISSPYISYLLQLDVSKKFNVKVYKVPDAIIADTSIIVNAHRRYLLAGIGEIFGKIIAVKDWELAHKIKGEEFSEFAAKLSLSSLEIINRNFEKLKMHNEKAVRIVVKALIGCGVAMAIAGSSRPCSGSEHMFCHAIDLLSRELNFKPALHGEQVALGTIMMAYLHGLNWKKIKKKMKQLGIPTTAYELGIDRDVILQALLIAHKIRPNRYTILGSDGLTKKAAQQLIEVTGIA